MCSRALLILLPFIIAIGAGYWLSTMSAAEANDLQNTQQSAPLTAEKFKNLHAATPMMIGKAGCMAGGCHGRSDADLSGSGTQSDAWQRACTTWSALDPHAKAYNVLDGTLGKQIMKNMHHLDNVSQVVGQYLASNDTRCLACHTNPALAATPTNFNEPSPILVQLRSEGVSCESCHGNAEKWQFPHVGVTRSPDRTAEFNAMGMRDLNRLSVRATECAGCHVGSKADPVRHYPTRDMNHDMIAAGHPRLMYDFALHLETLPKHWQEKTRPDGIPRSADSIYKSWLIGQVVALESLCELTIDRIDRSTDSKAPWPEFASMNCADCHHGLRLESFRNTSPRRYGKLGQARWDLNWPMNEPDLVELLSPNAKKETYHKALDTLEQTRNRNATKQNLGALGKILSDLRTQLESRSDADCRSLCFNVLYQEQLLLKDTKAPLSLDDAQRLFSTLTLFDRITAASPEATAPRVPWHRLSALPYKDTQKSGTHLALAFDANQRPSIRTLLGIQNVANQKTAADESKFKPSELRKTFGDLIGKVAPKLANPNIQP